MLRKQRKGWIAAVVVLALLSASVPAAAAGPAPGGEGWLGRLLGRLGLSPVWGLSSAHIDPNGQPDGNGGGGSAGTDSSIHIDPDGQPRSSQANTDDSIHIDPDG